MRFSPRGATLIDTSPMYSTAEAVLGDLLTPEQQAQGVHRHEGVDAGIGRRGRAEGRRADAALDGAAQAQAHRAHAGAQPGGSGRAPEDPAPLESGRPHQVHRRDALHHQLLPRSHLDHRARETRLRAVQLLGDHARGGKAPAAAVRGQGRRRARSTAPSRTATCSARSRTSRCRRGPRSSAPRAGRRCS